MIAIAFLLAAFLFVFLLYPIFFVLQGALSYRGEFSLEFLLPALRDTEVLALFLNSFNLSLLTTALATSISVPLAIVLSRYTFPGKGALQACLFLPLMLPPLIGALGLRRVLARFGSLNLILFKLGIVSQPIDWLGAGGMFGTAATQALHLFPILLLNLSASISTIDPSLEEAARISGATMFTRLTRIVLPLATPGYAAGAILVFVSAFTDLGTPLVFGMREILPTAIYELRNEIHENPLGDALVVVMLLFSSLLFLGGRMLFTRGFSPETQKGARLAQPRQMGRFTSILVLAAVACLVLLATLPHLMILVLSLGRVWNVSILPAEFGTRSYQAVLGHALTANSIRVSLVLGAASTLADLLLGVGAAYLLVRSRIPAKAALDALLMLPLAVPGIVLAFGYLGAFSGTILDARVNPMPLLIIGYSVRRLPFMVRSAVAGFEHSEKRLEEAAQASGAGPFRILRGITLPLISPHLIAGTILCFSFAILEVSESLILALEEKFYPITKAIYALLSRPDGPGVAAALGVISMLLTFACLAAARKILRQDLARVFRI